MGYSQEYKILFYKCLVLTQVLAQCQERILERKIAWKILVIF